MPETRWADLVSARATFCAQKLPHDCRELLHFVDDARTMMPVLGYASLDEFVRRGLRLDPALVTWAVEGLKQLKPDEPIPLDDAIATGLGKHGGDRKSAQAKDRDCNTSLIRYGTRDHWLARLERDGQTALAADVRAGRISAHAAAKQLGWRRTKTPLDQLRHWWQKASADERRTFTAELGDARWRKRA